MKLERFTARWAAFSLAACAAGGGQAPSHRPAVAPGRMIKAAAGEARRWP